jgi:hypothetical protein
LFSKTAAENIFRFQPQAKIIILLRHPADMLESLYYNYRANANENIASFRQAFAASALRRRGENIPPNMRSPAEGLFYDELGKYAGQVERYFELFGKEKVLVLFFDDLVSTPRSTMFRILEFLGVDTDVIPEVKMMNRRKVTRSKTLLNWMTDPPEFLRRAALIFFPHQTRRRDWLQYWLWKLNTKEAVKRETDWDFRKELIDFFRNDMLKLQTLTGRDLTHWLW